MNYYKWLKKFHVDKINPCVFNCQDIDENRQKRFIKQKEKYGFDERETWSLDYTLALWLYSHLKMYKKKAGKVIDLTYHTFEIPVKWNSKKLKTATEKEAIDIVIKNLEFYLKKYDNFKFEENAINKYRYALNVIAIISPALWW